MLTGRKMCLQKIRNKIQRRKLIELEADPDFQKSISNALLKIYIDMFYVKVNVELINRTKDLTYLQFRFLNCGKSYWFKYDDFLCSKSGLVTEIIIEKEVLRKKGIIK